MHGPPYDSIHNLSMARLWLLAAVFSMTILSPAAVEGRTFVIDYENSQFLKDGNPYRFVAGAIHYFRVPREYWEDRLYKVRMAGLNAIDVYIQWSGHEPEPGQYYFGGDYDVETFFKMAQKLELAVILRPGPYICGETDNAGFPYWLLRKHPDMMYRSRDTNFTSAVDAWFGHFLPKMKPLLYNNGGPIIMVQVENEYGNYNVCDKAYMEYSLSILEKHLGKDVVYFRADPPSYTYYTCDYVRDALVAGCCDPRADLPTAFQKIVDAQPKKGAPIVVIEYYTGWMDYWSYPHNPSDPPRVISTFEGMMNRNASVSFYMFHGGTSFGFQAATSSGRPLVTSYDYDAPMTEAGDPRPLYNMIRNSVAKYLSMPEGRPPESSLKMSILNVMLTQSISLEEVMNHFREKHWLTQTTSEDPITFEQLGQDFGFLLYKAKVTLTVSGVVTVQLMGLRDRAYVFSKTKWKIIYVRTNITTAPITIDTGDDLIILVENMGREDYGKQNRDPKGITGVKLNGQPVKNWTIEAVPVTKNRDITELMKLFDKEGEGKVPGFFHGTFQVPEGEQVLDTYLDPTGWNKGVAFINGVNIGRYWPVAGPQVTLYVPAPYLLHYPEENSVFLLELEGAPENDNRKVHFVETPRLDGETTFKVHP